MDTNYLLDKTIPVYLNNSNKREQFINDKHSISNSVGIYIIFAKCAEHTVLVMYLQILPPPPPSNRRLCILDHDFLNVKNAVLLYSSY
jgi:hypothetical protein